MKEADLRKWHRTLGGLLALFLALQGLTGAVLSFVDAAELQKAGGIPWWYRAASGWHTGGEGALEVLRGALGVGLLLMAGSGAFIYMKIRARSRKT